MSVILRDTIIPNAVKWFTGEALLDSDGENILNFDSEEYDSEEDGDYIPQEGDKGTAPPCNQQ